MRNRLISEEEEERLRQYILENLFNTTLEIKTDLNLPVTLRTISNYCNKLNLPSRVSAKKFLINNSNTQLRLEVAKVRRYWTSERWENIVFTDESGLDNSGKQHRRVRRPLGTRYNQENIFKHQNATLSRANFFSYISKFGVGDLIFCETMNEETYCQIIPTMIEELKQIFNHENFKIVHDNARWSTSRYTREFLKVSKFEKFFISIPPYSPDMNIIENC